MTRGTSYFFSRAAAIRYYKDYHYDDTAAAVDRKLREGEIHIGKPPLKAGERLIMLDGGKRYGIVENPMKRKAKRTNAGRTVKIGKRKIRASSRRAARILRRLVAAETSRERRNPESQSAEMYRMFHGRDPQEIVEYITQEHMHHNLWGVGDLVQLTVVTPQGYKVDIDLHKRQGREEFADPSGVPAGDRVVLAANEDCNQLFLVSGDQSLDLDRLHIPESERKDNTLVGALTALVYQTRKDFHKFELTDYTHKTGEESGVRPLLVYHPRTPSMEIVGGRYRIERPGIID